MQFRNSVVVVVLLGAVTGCATGANRRADRPAEVESGPVEVGEAEADVAVAGTMFDREPTAAPHQGAPLAPADVTAADIVETYYDLRYGIYEPDGSRLGGMRIWQLPSDAAGQPIERGMEFEGTFLDGFPVATIREWFSDRAPHRLQKIDFIDDERGQIVTTFSRERGRVVVRSGDRTRSLPASEDFFAASASAFAFNDADQWRVGQRIQSRSWDAETMAVRTTTFTVIAIDTVVHEGERRRAARLHVPNDDPNLVTTWTVLDNGVLLEFRYPSGRVVRLEGGTHQPPARQRRVPEASAPASTPASTRTVSEAATVETAPAPRAQRRLRPAQVSASVWLTVGYGGDALAWAVYEDGGVVELNAGDGSGAAVELSWLPFRIGRNGFGVAYRRGIIAGEVASDTERVRISRRPQHLLLAWHRRHSAALGFALRLGVVGEMDTQIDHFDRYEMTGGGHHGSASVQWHSGNRVGLELSLFHETTRYNEVFDTIDGASSGVQGALTVELF